MNEVSERLKKCFRTVFPNLADADIPQANVARVADWDSTAGIILLQVVEEEFQTGVDLERLAELDSFESLAEYLSHIIKA